MNLPPHPFGLNLEHNVFKTFSSSIELWLEQPMFFADTFPSAEERARILETGSLWTLQWYPASPRTFCFAAAASLEALLDYAATVTVERPHGAGRTDAER